MRAKTVTPESRRGNRFHRIAMGFTRWPATYGNGAAIGIGQITTRRWPKKADWRATHKGRTHHLIRLSLTRRNAFIAAAHFFAMNTIARATSSERAAKAKSTPARIISVFAA